MDFASPDLRTIAINGRFLSQNVVTGIQRYAHELLKALNVILGESESVPGGIEILAPPDAKDIPHLSNFCLRRVGRLRGQAWEQAELPFYSRNKVLVTLTGGAPVLHSQNVITIHDAAVFAAPDAYSYRYRVWYQWLHRRLSRSALQVLTVSEFSKSELVRYCQIEPGSIAVIHSGVDHVDNLAGDASILDKHQLLGTPYVLVVSSRNPTKNFKGVLRAIEILQPENIRFVVAGAINRKIFGHTQQFPSSVLELGYVTDAQLHSLYRNAGCFVFPSFYEGFGFPPLEAMASGCPVVVSNAASLPEVCGPAALYCDPTCPETIAEQIRIAIFDEGVRNRLIKDGTEQARIFVWRKTAEETWAVLKAIARQS